METAFWEYHSGAAPAMGSRWIPTFRAFASSAARCRIREQSTHDPMWRTGGIPSDSHTFRRPGPARDAADGWSSPAFPEAMAAHPVSTQRMSLLISCFARVICP